MLEHTSVTQPHRVLDLLQFDMHYLHVLQFSSILAKSRPVGIDPMSLEERGAFKKRLIEIFWRPKTDQTKYPDPVTLLRLFGHLVERLQEKPVLPPIEGVDEPLVSPPPKVMSYDSVELERAVELKDLEKLEDLVVRARLTWFGLPGELADSYARSYHEVSPETVTDRIAGRLTDIAQLVEAEKFKQAATMILSCMFSSGEKDPYDAARKKLDEARKALQGVPEVFFLDHRNWETLDAAPVKRSPAALLSFSHIAQLEGVTTEDIAALDL